MYRYQTAKHGFYISLKRRGWCWFYHLNEAGLRAIQIGPVIIEIWYNTPHQVRNRTDIRTIPFPNRVAARRIHSRLDCKSSVAGSTPDRGILIILRPTSI